MPRAWKYALQPPIIFGNEAYICLNRGGQFTSPQSFLGFLVLSDNPASIGGVATLRLGARFSDRCSASGTACILVSDSPMQRSMKFGLVVLVTTAVLVVLITPAPDELACTIRKRDSSQAVLVSITTMLPLVNRIASPTAQPSGTSPTMALIVDIFSANCTFLC
jgi:hypothetical protein